MSNTVGKAREKPQIREYSGYELESAIECRPVILAIFAAKEILLGDGCDQGGEKPL